MSPAERKRQAKKRLAGVAFPECWAHPMTYVRTTTMRLPGPGMQVRDGRADGWLRAPEDECRHGRLPGDRVPSCGCWDEVAA